MIKKILIIFIFALTIVTFCQWMTIKELRYYLMDFQRANSLWKYSDSLIRELKKHCANDWIIVYAIGYKERGLGTHTYGIKKIDRWIQASYPPPLWQMIQCRELVRERFKYPPSLDSFRAFGDSFCPGCKHWGDDVWLIYKKKMREECL